MASEDIQADIRGFLADELGVDAETITAETKLFSSRLLNSIDILNIVGFIEETYKVKVGTWEVSLERFDTLPGIAEYVESKLG